MPARFPIVTVDGFSCVLVLPPIAWQRRPRVIHNLTLTDAEGRTGIETREGDHPDVRLSFDYGYTLDEAESEELLALLDDLDPDTQRVLLPLWPDLLPAVDYMAQRIWASQHWMNIDVDAGLYTLDAAGDGHPESVGLAMCSLLELPARKPRNDVETDINIRAEEDSPWSARIAINALEQTTWAFEADWSSPPDDTSRWQQKRRRLGHGRLSTRTGTDAPTKRGQAAGFTFTTREEIRQALTFWEAHRGPLLPFTVPLYFRPGWDGTPEGRPVMQAHFYEETLALEFAQPAEARTRLKFDQDFVLIEGQPEQARPSRGYLFKLWWDGSATLKTWTDWPVTYTHAGLDYIPRAIECQAATETLVAGQNDWSLLVEDFEGNPLRAFGRLAVERRLLIEIREFNPAVANAAVLVFVGEIKSAPNKGPIYTATAAFIGEALKHLIPPQTVKQSCNNTLGDELCGKDIETLKVVGTVTATSTSTVVDVTCGDASIADSFALGFAVFGAGDDIELRYVMRSTPIGGGQRLTLNRPLWSSGTGAAVALYPGCDQQFLGGCAKYGRQGSFFGAPYKPTWMETVISGFKMKAGK